MKHDAGMNYVANLSSALLFTNLMPSGWFCWRFLKNWHSLKSLTSWTDPVHFTTQSVMMRSAFTTSCTLTLRLPSPLMGCLDVDVSAVYHTNSIWHFPHFIKLELDVLGLFWICWTLRRKNLKQKATTDQKTLKKKPKTFKRGREDWCHF